MDNQNNNDRNRQANYGGGQNQPDYSRYQNQPDYGSYQNQPQPEPLSGNVYQSPRTDQRNRSQVGDVLQGLNDLGVKNLQVNIDPANFKPPDTRNLGRDLLNSWINLLTHPTLATFKAQGAKTSWLVAITSVLVMGVIAAVVGTIRGIAGNVVFGVIGAIPNLLITPLLTIGGFFLVAIVLYLVARRMGGTGDFGSQTKLLGLLAPLYSVGLLIAAPHSLIFALVGLIVGLYMVFMMYQMVRATHNLDQRNAAIIVALPALLVLLGIIF